MTLSSGKFWKSLEHSRNVTLAALLWFIDTTVFLALLCPSGDFVGPSLASSSGVTLLGRWCVQHKVRWMDQSSSSSVHLELEPGALGPLFQSYPDLVLLDFVRALCDFNFHGELGHGERVPSLAHGARHVEAELPEPDLKEREEFFISW